MAWTSPKTWASGYIVLAADLNTHLRDNLNVTAPAVMTTQGDIVIASGANTPIRLAKSTTSTQYLANTGTSNAPAWDEVALTTGVSGILPTANGGLAIALSAPGADRILFWDHSATAYAYLTAGSGLTVSGTTMTVAALLAVVDDTSPQLGGNLDMQARLLVGNGGSTGIAISSAGEVNMTAQPGIFVFVNGTISDVTGDGTTYTIIQDGTVFDQNADHDGTSTFTAPVTGRYCVVSSAAMEGLVSGNTDGSIKLVTSNRDYRALYNPTNVANSGSAGAFDIMRIVDMDANDTLTANIAIGAGSKLADIVGNATPTGIFSSLHIWLEG